MSFSLKNYSRFHMIGHGGMSEIFRAVERSSRRKVVIKKMALDPANRAFSLERYQNEARNASALSHVNIISILDHGEYGDDFYIVMERIDGFDLESLMSVDAFNREIGLMIVFNALQALNFAHKKGVIHCDIKPANILIDRTGRVVLADFGLSQAKAHAMDPEKRRRDFTTPLYMPPEQAKVVAEQVGLASDVWAETASIVYNDMSPDQARALSERGMQWDLWSVGVLLYRICSGCFPFNGNDLAGLLTSIVHSEATKIHELVVDLPRPIAAVIERCLEKEPYRRPHSLDPVIDALQKYFFSLDITNIQEMISSHIRDKMGVLTVAGGSLMHEVPPAGVPSFGALPRMASIIKPVLNSTAAVLRALSRVAQSESPERQVDSEGTQQGAGQRVVTFISSRSRFALPLIALVVCAFLFVFGTLVYKEHGGKSRPAAVFNLKHVEEVKGAVPVERIIRKASPTAAEKKAVTKRIALSPSAKKAESDSLPVRKKNAEPAERKRTTQSAPNALTVKKTVPAKAANSPGILKITIDPSEAQVFIDGAVIPHKEMSFGRHVFPGFHDIVASAPGYKAYQRSYLMEANTTQLLSIILKAEAKGNGQLHIYSYPWANLYLDGTLIGTTPTPSPIALLEGDHRVMLRRDGYKLYQEVVSIRNGEVTRLQVQLERSGDGDD